MKTYKINEITNKRILGRNIAEAGKADSLNLFWGASALEFVVKAKEVWINVNSNFESAEPWMAVEINGAPVTRFMVLKDAAWICIARNLNPEKENLITIMKDTQPMTAEALHSLFINQVGLDDDGIFMPVPPRKLKIEFIGDSITSGEGLAGGIDEMDWIPEWFSSSKTYAVKTAKALNADWSMFSQSGWGICWAWDGNRNNAIPPYYNEVCSVMWGEYQEKLGVKQPFNFGTGSDYVVINLGTNDNGAFNQSAWKDEKGVEYKLEIQKDGPVVGKGVYDFLKVIRSKNPNAKIIWCWGMIKLDKIPSYIQEAVDSYKKDTGDSKVYTLELDPMEEVEITADDKGSRCHPGPKTHRLAAEKLIEFINKK